jgi:hypothetical protein
MFNNKILILINFLIILVIILYFHTKKNKKEHFAIYEEDEYITKISGIRHNIAPGQTDDKCDKEEEEVEVLLNTSKDHLVYNKFCYKKGSQGNPTEKKYFVDNIQYTKEYKEEYEKESFDDETDVGIVKSDSDYLGCYSVPEDLKDELINNLTVDKNYKTMSACKRSNSNAIYFNSKITDKLGITDSGGNIQYKPVDEEDAHGKKSFCSTITDAQYKTLLTSHRVADKFCLGNSDLVGTNNLLSNGGRVKNYLGGIDTIAIYKNGSDITKQGKPTVVYQKTKLKSNLDCSGFVSLKCLQKFKKHVLGWYDIKNNYKITTEKEKTGNYTYNRDTLETGTNTNTIRPYYLHPDIPTETISDVVYYVFNNLKLIREEVQVHPWLTGDKPIDFLIRVDKLRETGQTYAIIRYRYIETIKGIEYKKPKYLTLHQEIKNGDKVAPENVDDFIDFFKGGRQIRYYYFIHNNIEFQNQIHLWDTDISKAVLFKLNFVENKTLFFLNSMDKKYPYEKYIERIFQEYLIDSDKYSSKNTFTLKNTEVNDILSKNANEDLKKINQVFRNIIYGFVNKYSIKDGSEIIKNLVKIQTSFIPEGYTPPVIKTFLLYDCSGNNNHMFPNYNKLHFIGNFKFNENRKAITDDYSYYDSEGNNTILTKYINTTFKDFYDEHKLNKSSDFFAVRKKNSQVINKAEFASISAIPSFDKLVKDSLTLRGNYQELPNLGMPEWNNSGKAHSRIVPPLCSGSKQLGDHGCGCYHGSYNCHDLACQNWEQLATILKGTEGNGIFDDKGKIYPNPIHHSVTQILDSTAVDYFKGIDDSKLVLKSQDKMFIESSHQLVKKLNKQFFICFSYKNYDPKTATTPKEHNHKNNNTHEHSAQTNENEFSINNQKTKNSIVGNPIFSLCSNFQSKEQTSDGGYKPQSFLWSFIDKYNGKNDNEGLLYVKPKKIGVITFKPGDGHKLCVSDIQIFDKDGNKKKLSQEDVLIKRKDNKFKQDDDAILAKNLQDGDEILSKDTQNEEQSYCFTYNPHFIVAKLWIDDNFKIPFRLDTKGETSYTNKVYGFKRTEGPDNVNHKGTQLSVIPTGGVEGERPNEVPMPGDDEYIVRQTERYYSYKHNTFSAKGTDDDEYVLILKEPIYISRIIIRSPIIDVTYDHQADEITSTYDALNLINLPGSKIDTSFKTTKMKLLDAEGTVYKNLKEQFVNEDGEKFKRDESDLTLTVPKSEIVSQKSFADDIDDVEDIRLKNSVIDFWNVSFLKLKTNSEKESVRIRGIQSIKNNDNDKYKISIFNVKENGNVEESEAFEVDEDYLKISQTNFSLKMGNLFNKHSDIQFKNLKIFSNEFVEDNKSAKEKSVSGKTNDIKDFNLENYRKSMTQESYKNIRNNILLEPVPVPKKNIYDFYHDMITTKEDDLYKAPLISEGEKSLQNIFNIFSMLSNNQNSKDAKAEFSIKKFNTTDHLQYQYDKNYAIGYIDLDNQDKGDKNTKILPGDLYYKNY